MKKIVAFFIFSVTNMFVSMCGSLITPFFPPIANSVGISQTTLGFIISAAPLGGLFASIVIAKTLSSKNRMLYMLLGVLGEPISLSLFSLTSIYEADERNKIIIIASVGRFIGGIGTSLFLTPFFGFVPIMYPKDVEKKISISEAFSSIGALAGPVLGSILFELGGFKTPFIVFSTFGVIALPFVYFALRSVMPKKYRVEVKRQQDELEEDRRVSIIQESLLGKPELFNSEKRLTLLSLMTHYPIVVIFLVICILNVCLTYFQPILSIYLKDGYGLSEAQVGYTMTIVTVAHTISCYFCGFVKERKREMAGISLFLIGISYTLCGPDTELIGVPKKLIYALIAQGLLGMFFAPSYVPSLPVANEFLLYNYPTQKVRAATYSSALLTGGMFIGQLSGPIIAGIMGDLYGFPRACSLLGMMLVLTAFLYVPVIFMKSKREPTTGITIGEIKVNNN